MGCAQNMSPGSSDKWIWYGPGAASSLADTLQHAQLKNAMNMNCGPLSCVIKLSQLPATAAEQTAGTNNSRLSTVFLSTNYFFILRIILCRTATQREESQGIAVDSTLFHCGGCERKEVPCRNILKEGLLENISSCIIITSRGFCAS